MLEFLLTQNAALKAQLKALEADKRRLDWLIRQSDPFEIFGAGIPEWDTDKQLLDNWRAAIDAAMEAHNAPSD